MDRDDLIKQRFEMLLELEKMRGDTSWGMEPGAKAKILEEMTPLLQTVMAIEIELGIFGHAVGF